MGERRPLVAGIKPERSIEEQFVRTGKLPDAEPPAAAGQTTAREAKASTANTASRAPLTTRVRADFAEALKRASLQRQLDGVTPHTLQEILEEALEPWLRKHGYIQ
jgi:cell pole-organizing protein PopZ